MVKVQCCTFQQCFGPFTMLLVKSYPERGLFRHLSNHVFWSPYIQKYISNEGHFFRKISRFDLNLENAKKNSKNIFRFWDNCIWKCSYKVPLLRTEYLLFAANGLKKVLRFCISFRDTFSTWINFTGINKYGKGALLHISTAFGPVYHVTCWRVLSNGTS